jgi:hypothetical protein
MLGAVTNKDITTIRELSKSEYDDYSASAKCLFDFLYDWQLYFFVRLNYDEYTKLLKRYLQEYAENPRTTNMRAMYFEINRCMSNYLFSFRMFLDHNTYNLVKRYGSQSPQFTKFKKICSHVYDDSFSYRFLSKLRNYVQHCGIPLGSVHLAAKESGLIPGGIERSLSVEFDRDSLLEKFENWGSRVRAEVQKLPRHFEVTPHIAEAMKCIETIYIALIGDDLPRLLQAAEHINQLALSAKGVAGVPSILLIEKSGIGTQDLKVEIRHMPLDIAEMVMNIRKH